MRKEAIDKDTCDKCGDSIVATFSLETTAGYLCNDCFAEHEGDSHDQ